MATPTTTTDTAGRVEPSMTLGEIVTFNPSLAVELQRRGFDFCCHGARTLTEAAAELDLDAATVAAELSAVRGDEPPAEWASLTPAELLDHVVEVHHRYLWDELPRINALVDKIVSVHGDRHPELAEVQRLFVALRADLEPHLTNEEEVVFPALRTLANDPSTRTDAVDAQVRSLTFGDGETRLTQRESGANSFCTPSAIPFPPVFHKGVRRLRFGYPVE